VSERDYAIGVCGFPRCGSSMTMRMLHAGGIEPVEGSSPVSYELPGLAEFADHDPTMLIGRAVKLLDYVQWYGTDALPNVPWRFIWLDRNSRQQARSFVKFVSAVGGALTDADVPRIRSSFEQDRASCVAALQDVGPVLVLKYERTLRDPMAAGRQLEEFCGVLGLAAAVMVHDRSPECAPDLAFEMQGVAS